MSVGAHDASPPPYSKKTPAKRHSRSARKLPKKASPNGTAAYPTSIQRNFPDIFHTVKASSQREGTPSGSKGGSTEKSGGLLRAKSMEKAKPFHDDVIFLIFFGQADYRIYLLNKIFIRSNNDKIIFITAKLYFYIKSVCDFDLFGIYRLCPLCVVHARS